jgi:hypothetical protein
VIGSLAPPTDDPRHHHLPVPEAGTGESDTLPTASSEFRGLRAPEPSAPKPQSTYPPAVLRSGSLSRAAVDAGVVVPLRAGVWPGLCLKSP